VLAQPVCAMLVIVGTGHTGGPPRRPGPDPVRRPAPCIQAHIVRGPYPHWRIHRSQLPRLTRQPLDPPRQQRPATRHKEVLTRTPGAST
jgi:hypothetical protein